jgi:peptide/nickel transport system permease protein
MIRYIARRLAATCLLTWGVVTIASLVIRLAPGNVVEALLQEGTPPPQLVQLRKHVLGIDRPYIVQYLEWLGGLTRLNLGMSLANERPISPDIARALPRTFELIGADLFVTVGTLAGISVPIFVKATLMILCFGLLVRWFPTAGIVTFAEDPLGHLRHLLLNPQAPRGANEEPDSDDVSAVS